MFYNAKNCSLPLQNGTMDYITFGLGQKPLVILPGLGDGLKTVKGTAVMFAMLYKIFAKEYTVYVFSRKNPLPNGYSIKDMAQDQALAMHMLGIKNADVLGVSQGGMIAQRLAIHYPELVHKLVLAVTVCEADLPLKKVVSNWIAFAKQKDYKNLMIDTAEKSYSLQYLKKHRMFYPLLAYAGKPKSFDRFIIQAQACLSHNTKDLLDKIQCPTLIIAGGQDQVVGAKSYMALSQKIKHSKLLLYPQFGHAAYEEAKDFNQQILFFFTQG